MSSNLQSALLLRVWNYVFLVISAAVIYDYFLMFSREINYVWCRRWTWVSTMFVLVRYVGLSLVILASLFGTTFVPGPTKICTALSLVIGWEYEIFINTADLIMTLRVYAMWNRSQRILWVLLFTYVPQVIVSVVIAGIYNNPNTYLSVTATQFLDLSFCNISINYSPMIKVYATLLRLVFSIALLVLAIIPTLKQSIGMYKATGQWQANQYMQQLVSDGILYFLLIVFYYITNILQLLGIVNGISLLFLDVFSGILVCPMIPRFIISMRELYDRDLHRRWQGDDTAFGVLSQPIARDNAVVSAIVFADVVPGQDQVVEGNASGSEAIRLETLGDNTHQA